MCTPLCSSALAASPASVPPCAVGSRSCGGGRGCVRQERKRPRCVRASVRGASVWQVGEDARFGVSSLGRAFSALPRRGSDPGGAQPDRAAPLSPRPAPGLRLAPGFARLHPHPGAGGRGAGRPPQPSLAPAGASALASGFSFALGGWAVCLFSHLPIFWFRPSCFLEKSLNCMESLSWLID